MITFVADASLTLAWCFEDEATPETDALLQRLKRSEEAIVPTHWSMEVTNGLLMAVRRRRINEEKAHRFIKDLVSLPIKVDAETTIEDSVRILSLAQQHGLIAYDAAYLDLAQRKKVFLSSLDSDLRKAASAVGVPVA